MGLCCEITVPEMVKHVNSSEKHSKTLDVVGIPVLPIVPSHPINDSATIPYSNVLKILPPTSFKFRLNFKL